MSERPECRHCNGSGKSDLHCCVAKSGFTPKNWGGDPYVVCCACGGSGLERKAQPYYNT